MTVISDGPYGINGYPGDTKKPEHLPQIYEPHIAAWSKAANTQTTLWFWNTEIGWAIMHPILVKHGWIYRSCNIWDKGVSHIAGNCNGKTMRKFPVVTEICVHYIREPQFNDVGGNRLSLQDWLRNEWRRTGLPFHKANEACEVKNAASRKYLTADHMFYPPPPDIFAKLAIYANKYGNLDGKPYFNLNDEEVENGLLIQDKWQKLQSKFNFEYGGTNVWRLPANRGKERLKDGMKVVHGNQKPFSLMERIIKASTDENDVIWEPFCGLASASIIADSLNRIAYTSEISNSYYMYVKNRIEQNVVIG